MEIHMSSLAKLACAFLALGLAGAASATTIEFDGSSYASLHGSDGSLTIVPTGVASQYQVTWSLDTTGFVGDATHDVVQSLAFKAFTSMTTVSEVAGGPAGVVYASSNVNNSNPNCAQMGSAAGFVCFDFVPDVSATSGSTISKTFLVTGTLDESLAWSFRGKYGTGNGWVISEQNTPPVPEPASAVLFGMGALILAARTQRKRD
jgi:hypothetical protein